jgi:SAM-dependent methyltransferase
MSKTGGTAPDFNGLARIYRWMEFASFGPWLGLTRRTYLERMTGARRALVLGDGDGRFTARLLEENKEVRVDAVDASAAMLDALLRRSGPDAERVRVHLADVRNWEFPAPIVAQPYNLVATHFLLDCLTTQEVRQLAGRVRGAVDPGALWVVSEFAIPAGGAARMLGRPIVAALYFCFGVLTGMTVCRLPDHGQAMRDAGFELVERKARLGGLLVAELWSVARQERG